MPCFATSPAGTKMVRKLVYQMRAVRCMPYELEDMMAQGMLGVVEAECSFRRGRGRGAGKGLRSWCWKRAWGSILDGRRRAHPYSRPTGFVPHDRLEDVDEPEVSSDSAARADIARLLSHLPEQEAFVVSMVHLMGHTQEEAGAMIGLSKSWACRLDRRGLARLRDLARP